MRRVGRDTAVALHGASSPVDPALRAGRKRGLARPADAARAESPVDMSESPAPRASGLRKARRVCRLLLLQLAACASSGCPGTAAYASEPEAQTVEQATIVVRKSYQFLRYLPPDYDADPVRLWPLVLFLHGAAERGSDIERVKRQGLPRRIAEGATFPAVIISPQCPAEEWWNVPALDALVEKIASEARIDRERIYATGLSMGGFGTWALAIHSPGRYAAILPICAGGEIQRAWVLRDTPVWTFHGDLDSIVPIARSQQMVDAIRAAGGSPRFTVYPGYHHDAWTITYEDAEVMAWLFAQRRDARPPVSEARR